MSNCNFKDRLLELKKQWNCKTQQEMASRLDITRGLYSMLETGTRQPSKKFLIKLQELTGKSEQYWLYGTTSLGEYLNQSEDFQMIKDAYLRLSSSGDIDENMNFSDLAKEILLSSLKADFLYLKKDYSTFKEKQLK